MRRWFATIAAIAFLAMGCANGGSSASTAASPAVGTYASSAAASAAAVATSTATGPIALPICINVPQCPIDAGTYRTVGSQAFMPGLTLTIPVGWFATEASSGEISLHLEGQPDQSLLLWKDVVAVVSNHRTTKIGITPVKGIGTTPDALVKWFTSNPDFAVITPPKSAVVGDGISGTILTMGVSDGADFGDADCPVNPHCAAFVTDPRHWGDEFYAIGAPGVTRMFLTTVSFPSGDHTFLVTLDALSAADLESFATQAKPIIDSLRLPTKYIDT
jgi:hypothetical protein